VLPRSIPPLYERASSRAPLWPVKGEVPGLLHGPLNVPARVMPGPADACHVLPAPVLSPRAIAGTPMSCPRPLANGGEGVPLPTVSLSLRGVSQGEGGAALRSRWRRRVAYPLATAHVARRLMRRLQGRQRNKKVALKPRLRRLTEGLPCKFLPRDPYLHASWCPRGHDSSVANYRKQESLDSQLIDFPVHDFRIWPRKGNFAPAASGIAPASSPTAGEPVRGVGGEPWS
jgi:hypothetical protein